MTKRLQEAYHQFLAQGWSKKQAIRLVGLHSIWLGTHPRREMIEVFIYEGE
jgi:hypothetical protein